ncbi:cysteine-rich repeat secretory protein 38-like [Cajanus cajan]|uniref:cysteine-rich repeat secretory protein 38-like n=1 Tax=Cajanus cajan TaxID=3821 RepID=UPI00098DAF05|nr:cysteine-rich repeat secretory protein 38-like [Cajanus cajan]
MRSNSSNTIISFCILITFTTTIQAQLADPVFVKQVCSPNQTTTTNTATYENNLRTLLSLLSSNATATKFHTTTVLGTTSSDTLYGLFMCRLDVPSHFCFRCVSNATTNISSDPECSLSKQGVTWYAECMVRFSNVAFFSTVDTSPSWALSNHVNASSNSTLFMGLLFDAMNRTAEEAANSGNCSTCLGEAIGYLPSCCEGKEGGRVGYPSCTVWYELYPFYGLATNQTPTKTSPSSGDVVTRLHFYLFDDMASLGRCGVPISMFHGRTLSSAIMSLLLG